MDCDGLIEYDRMIEQISSAVCFFNRTGSIPTSDPRISPEVRFIHQTQSVKNSPDQMNHDVCVSISICLLVLFVCLFACLFACLFVY